MAKLLFIFFFMLYEGRATIREYNFIEVLKPNQTIYLTSPRYPDGIDFVDKEAKWSITCPVGYNCKLHCPKINLEMTYMCHAERFLISKSDTTNFYGAQMNCGEKTNITATSTGNVMYLGYFSNKKEDSKKIRKSRFVCTITSEPIPGPIKFNSPFLVDEKKECNCGRNEATRAGVAKLPLSAVVKIGNLPNVDCVGTIVSDRYILTTATCISVFEIHNDTSAHTYNTTFLIKDSSKIYEIESVKLHELYNPNSTLEKKMFTNEALIKKKIEDSANYINYDFAIIQINDNAFREHVFFNKAICLPYKYKYWDFVGIEVYAVDWNNEEKVVIESYETYTRSNSVYHRIVVKDVTKGMSFGSPLIYKDEQTRRQTILGLKVKENEYIKIEHFIDWISLKTKNEICKSV